MDCSSSRRATAITTRLVVVALLLLLGAIGYLASKTRQLRARFFSASVFMLRAYSLLEYLSATFGGQLKTMMSAQQILSTYPRFLSSETMPGELSQRVYHPYRHGYGKLMHSGYHFLDLLTWFTSINESCCAHKAAHTFEVYCRRFGVPLIDGGTVRLPRLIGASRALDMILTGRPVAAEEALQFGLANRRVPAGTALQAATDLAMQIAEFPQTCMRNDRSSAMAQWSLDLDQALSQEFAVGMQTLESGETLAGAGRFAGGVGRHGEFGA